MGWPVADNQSPLKQSLNVYRADIIFSWSCSSA
jgi:hypothetical protein